MVKVQGMVSKEKQLENQITILMDLMKMPEEKRNFVELKNRIEKVIEEKDILATQIKSNNDNSESMAEVSPLQKIFNTPGLVHLAENILDNLDYEGIHIYQDINHSSQQILSNPMFWLKKVPWRKS